MRYSCSGQGHDKRDTLIQTDCHLFPVMKQILGVDRMKDVLELDVVTPWLVACNSVSTNTGPHVPRYKSCGCGGDCVAKSWDSSAVRVKS